MMKHKIQSLNAYISEDFKNPFDDDNSKIVTKPSHIADKGGVFTLRKEVFNINRVEYSKRANGAFTVLSKTQFAKGEIIEIAPILIVGPETKNIAKLKDYIFELDKSKQIYGVVLGYGSLYGHNEKPNVTYAYNKRNKLMYFITAKQINAGEELTINYGTDYWQDRMEFGTMAQPTLPQPTLPQPTLDDTSESEVEANILDIQDNTRKDYFSKQNSMQNPAVSGVAIKGAGSQS